MAPNETILFGHGEDGALVNDRGAAGRAVEETEYGAIQSCRSSRNIGKVQLTEALNIGEVQLTAAGVYGMSYEKSSRMDWKHS